VPSASVFPNSKSLSFDGTNEHLTTTADGTLATKTYSFWAKSSNTARHAVYDHGGSVGGVLFFNWSNKPALYNGTGYYVFWEDNPAQDDGNWHHWLLYQKHDDIAASKLYCDGVLQSISTTSTGDGAGTAYTSGIRIGSQHYPFSGHLDEFAIFDGDKTGIVADLYNSGVPTNLASTAGLEHWWRMGDATEPAADGTSDLIFDQADKTLGSELVTNGDYETGDFTGWTTHNSGGQTLEVATNAAGSNALHIVSDGTFCGVTQDITKPAGTVFKFCFDLEVISGSAVTVIEGVINTHSNSGRYEIFGTSSGSTISLEIKRNLTCEFYIDNVSVKEVNGATATMTNMDSGDIVQYTPNSYILSDLGITPDLAVSMTRKLVSDYSGSFYATSGSDVTTIYDQSGNSRNLTNYGSGDEVTLSGSGNLARAVFSSSSNSVLTTSTLGSAFPAGNHDVFMVFDPVGTDQQILFGRASTGGDFLAMDNGSSSNASNGITIGEIRVNDTILPATVSRNELWDAMTVSGTMGGLNVLSLEDVDLSSIGGDIRLGASNDTWRLEGSFAEFIITPPLSDAQHSAIVENIRAHYDAP